MQVYTKHYKQVVLDNSYGLLRKARRLDTIMMASSEKPGPSRAGELPLSDDQCHACHTEYSPFFHPLDTNKPPHPQAGQDRLVECHVCYSKKWAHHLPMGSSGPSAPISEVPASISISVGV